MFEDPYDQTIEQALCRNESPADAILELTHPERLELQGEAAAYVKAVFEGFAVRQAHLLATRDTAAIAASNATFAESQARLGRALNAIVERT